VVHETLGAPLATIRVTVQQVPAAFWAVGDRRATKSMPKRKAATAASSQL